MPIYLLIKATTTKTITVPAYTRKDGTVVPEHQKIVHIDPDKDVHDIVSGQGTHSQKQAHKKLSKIPEWNNLPHEHKLAHILSAATNIQKQASLASSVVGFKKMILAGKVPYNSQTNAFVSQPKEKILSMMAELTEKVGEDKFKELAVVAFSKLRKQKNPELKQKDPVVTSQSKEQTDAAQKISEVLQGKYGHYAKKAAESLSSDAKWQMAQPLEQLKMITGAAKELQADAANVHGFHHSILSGQLPTPEQYSAFDKLAPEKKEAAVAKLTRGGGIEAEKLLTEAQQKYSGSTEEVTKPSEKTAEQSEKVEPVQDAPAHDTDSVNAPPEVQNKDAGDPTKKPSFKTELEFKDGKSNKFWSIEVEGTKITTSWGKIGTKGNKKENGVFTEKNAIYAAKQLVKEKLKKGYKVSGKNELSDGITASPLENQPESTGPKDGDTKQGAEGNLVFKDGRWHKVASSDPDHYAPTVVSVHDVLVQSQKDISGWKQVGEQEGSNDGGYFEDDAGQKWYCKFPKDDDIAKSEVLASKLYAACGIDVPELNLVTRKGKTGVASKYIDGLTKDKNILPKLAGASEGFAVDAWLGNWDVVGLGYDNLQSTGKKAIRVDVGGALEYRAQGTKKGKEFSDIVTEIESMRDASVNPQAAHVFSGMSQPKIKNSVKNVLKLSDKSIRSLCFAYGPGDKKEKGALADKLINRKNDLAKKYPDVAAEFRTTTKVVVPQAPNFLAWHGDGKGLSSKPHLNQQNQDLAEQINGLGKERDVNALQNMQFQPIGYETGKAEGETEHIQKHKSQHVVKYWMDVVHALENPVKVPPKGIVDVAVSEVGGIFGSLANMFKDTRKLVGHSHKLGRYAVLGKVTGGDLFQGWSPKQRTKAEVKANTQMMYVMSKLSFGNMSNTHKQAMKDYTGSAYKKMNDPVTGVGTHGKTDYVIDCIDKAAVPIPSGTILSRRFSFHENTSFNIQKLLESEGSVIKDFGIISTSVQPTTWYGNVQLRIVCGEGVRGLYVGQNPDGGGESISHFASESECILPYGSKFYVRKVMKNKKITDEYGTWGAGCDYLVEVVALPN